MASCIFCDFIKKNKKVHENPYKRPNKKYPVVPIDETKETFSFLSIPNNKGISDLLIIPKKHFRYLSVVPKDILSELISDVAEKSNILRKKYSGCTITLNEGKSARQYISHVHFHLTPKNNDKSESWVNLSVNQFKALSKELKSIFSR